MFILKDGISCNEVCTISPYERSIISNLYTGTGKYDYLPWHVYTGKLN